MTVQTLTQTMSAKGNLLRRALQADGLFEIFGGVTFIMGAKPLATLFGLDAAVLVESGIVMLIYGAWLLYIARQPSVNRWAALAAADLNAVGVIITGLILFTGWLPLTSAGWWTLAIIADVVAIFAGLQFYGVWQMSKR